MNEPPNLAGALCGGRHRLPLRVYYEDTDFSGLVYHASYLRFMERGRSDYLRLHGVDHRAMFEQPGGAGFAFVVRSMQIEFIRPAHMDDVLMIVTAPIDVRGASAVLDQQVLRGEETLVKARVKIACIMNGRPQRIPEPLRAAMEQDRQA